VSGQLIIVAHHSMAAMMLSVTKSKLFIPLFSNLEYHSGLNCTSSQLSFANLHNLNISSIAFFLAG